MNDDTDVMNDDDTDVMNDDTDVMNDDTDVMNDDTDDEPAQPLTRLHRGTKTRPAPTAAPDSVWSASRDMQEKDLLARCTSHQDDCFPVVAACVSGYSG
ncbi:hypothetical protein C0Q70_11944 [Pomacea canaliculata]|uniref:Uncharacterized protein n=1 Tax=Pomacea canaliculata TaxID=400727 RepID=A0A2T7P7H7_POMCA|nr:hypothetical protein C0Q70_11944 [Pomacea canaliculata]